MNRGPESIRDGTDARNPTIAAYRIRLFHVPETRIFLPNKELCLGRNPIWFEQIAYCSPETTGRIWQWSFLVPSATTQLQFPCDLRLTEFHFFMKHSWLNSLSCKHVCTILPPRGECFFYTSNSVLVITCVLEIRFGYIITKLHLKHVYKRWHLT